MPGPRHRNGFDDAHWQRLVASVAALARRGPKGDLQTFVDKSSSFYASFVAAAATLVALTEWAGRVDESPTFTFTAVPTASQEEGLRKHVGAARFAFNQSLRLVQDALETKKADDAARVPWSGFDLINAFNAWKLTPAAGLDETGQPGLAWRAEVCQQVF